MSFWRLHYHIIWATQDREPTITPEREKVLHATLYSKAHELELKTHAIGNVDDHIHIVISIPPKLPVADCVRQLKGASSFAVNHMPGSDDKFKWQAGYGALTIGEHSLETVIHYATHQKEHHDDHKNLVAVYEKIEQE